MAMATMVPPITMATILPTQANTGGGKEPSREIVTGPELHSTENPCYRQMLPQQQLQLLKPSTMISPFSLPPPLFIMDKKISQNSTRDLLVRFRLRIHHPLHHQEIRREKQTGAVLLDGEP